jgi:hypothetical protein
VAGTVQFLKKKKKKTVGKIVSFFKKMWKQMLLSAIEPTSTSTLATRNIETDAMRQLGERRREQRKRARKNNNGGDDNDESLPQGSTLLDALAQRYRNAAKQHNDVNVKMASNAAADQDENTDENANANVASLTTTRKRERNDERKRPIDDSTDKQVSSLRIDRTRCGSRRTIRAPERFVSYRRRDAADAASRVDDATTQQPQTRHEPLPAVQPKEFELLVSPMRAPARPREKRRVRLARVVREYQGNESEGNIYIDNALL